MKYLNLGCGQRFHKDWVNIDFHSSSKHVIAHNLLNGIPFGDNEFDAVYHSHVLEHFSKSDGKRFLAECHRVLKPGGIIRIAVPDLEQIVKNYLKTMEGALAGDVPSAHNYEWMMLELYDQAVRNYSGGEMAEYFYKEKIINEDFVFSRIGEEGRVIHEQFLKSKIKKANHELSSRFSLKKILNPGTYIQKVKNILFKKELDQSRFLETGKFRLGGEIHQWMYDRYSLGKLLFETGFGNVIVRTVFESSIDNWNDYGLESRNGLIFKPDSLFMEGQKIK